MLEPFTRERKEVRMSTNYENLLVDLSVSPNPAIPRVTLNRPERRNALSLASMRELTAWLRSIGESNDTRAVIVSAMAPCSFPVTT